MSALSPARRPARIADEALELRLREIDEASPTAKQRAIRELQKIGREIQRGEFP